MNYEQMCLDERFDILTRRRLIQFKRDRWKLLCDCPLPDNWPEILVENYSHDVYFNMAHGVPHDAVAYLKDKSCVCPSCLAHVGIEVGRENRKVNTEMVRMMLKERLHGESLNPHRREP